MIIHHLPHQNNVQQIGYKLLSTLNFKGKRGEEVARTLISACLWNDSVESKSRAYGVSPQTVRNYVEERGGSSGKAVGTSEEQQLWDFNVT